MCKNYGKTTNLIVKDYMFDGNYIFGVFYEIRHNKDGTEETFYILDDGDIYSEKQLKESGYAYAFISSQEIIEYFKDRVK